MFVPRSVAFSKPKKSNSIAKEPKLQKVEAKLSESNRALSEAPAKCHEVEEHMRRPPTNHAIPSSAQDATENKCFLFESESTNGPSVYRNEYDDENHDDDHNDHDDEKVVEESKDQRYPRKGEPVCVVCGRYGAYICDQTDKDVCSIECKQININSIKLPTDKNTSFIPHKTKDITNAQNSTSSGTAKKSPSSENVMTPAEFEVFFKDNYIYKEHIVIANLHQEKIDFLRQKLEIKLQGMNIPSLIIEFNHCGFHPTLNENLLKSDYLTPTPIQMQAIPIGLCRRDLIACAQTGTGKSASFLLPLIQRVSATTGRI